MPTDSAPAPLHAERRTAPLNYVALAHFAAALDPEALRRVSRLFQLHPYQPRHYPHLDPRASQDSPYDDAAAYLQGWYTSYIDINLT